MPGPLGIGGGGGGSGGTVTTPVFPFIDRAVAQTSDTGSITYATPGSSAIGDTAAAGTATTVSRSDHVHGREAAGTPGASAVGDTAAAGSATTVARSDHRHSREAFGTPVNIDASVTSLSAGSLTTVARADHIHTLSNAWIKIASTVTSGSATSITFSSLPQTFQHLRILGWGRSAYVGLTSGVIIRFNGDSGSNYNDAALGTADYTSVRIGLIPGTTQYYTNSSGITDVMLTGYSGTAFLKGLWIGYGQPGNTTSTYSQLAVICHGQWRSTAAITSIVISQDTGAAFTNGSIYTLMAC